MEAFIYDAVRTPRGKGRDDGALHSLSALEIMSQTLRAIATRSLPDTALIDDVVLGCVSPVREQGSDIGRLAALIAGYDESVAGIQVNRFCASGLEACNIAAAKVIAGEAMFAIGGGVEMMSRVPMGADDGPLAVDPIFAFDHYFVPQGVGADMLATLHDFSRDDVDGYAVESQGRAAHAWKDGRFSRSVVPVRDQAGAILLDRDEHIREGTSIESLAALKPAFQGMGETLFDAVAMQRYPEIAEMRHVHHAGNSSGIVDGAAAVLIGSREAGEAAGLKPRARIRGMASTGSEPTIMLTGPGAVTRKLLSRLGMTIADIDLFELNEAFAAVVLRYMQEFAIPHDRINVNGGAIAMGHPLGATGAMILGTVLDELERTDRETALVTLCVGAGMGSAALIERV